MYLKNDENVSLYSGNSYSVKKRKLVNRECTCIMMNIYTTIESLDYYLKSLMASL
jgi:hypothetical protein